jgi:hypothetical protein
MGDLIRVHDYRFECLGCGLQGQMKATDDQIARFQGEFLEVHIHCLKPGTKNEKPGVRFR